MDPVWTTGCTIFHHQEGQPLHLHGRYGSCVDHRLHNIPSSGGPTPSPPWPLWILCGPQVAQYSIIRRANPFTSMAAMDPVWTTGCTIFHHQEGQPLHLHGRYG